MIPIITDSSACLTRAEAESLGVYLVPMNYSVEGHVPPLVESFIDENDGVEEIVSRNLGRLRTSQATLHGFQGAFHALRAEGHEEALCIVMSSRLSGTYGNALMAGGEQNAMRVEVVDSLNTAGGLYLLIREARRLLDGGAPVAKAAEAIRVLRGRIRSFFSVDDITPLRNSGRLSGVRLSVSTILNIKPILQCADGSVLACGTARGRHEQIRALLNRVSGRIGELIVQYFTPDAQARAVAARLEKDGHRVSLRKIGPVLGIHLGFGCIGITWMDEEGTDE